MIVESSSVEGSVITESPDTTCARMLPLQELQLRSRRTHNNNKFVIKKRSSDTRTCPEAPSDRTCPEAPSDRTSPEAPSDRMSPEAPSDRTSPEAPSDCMSPEAPSDRTSPEAPSDYTSPEAPSDRMSLRSMTLEARGNPLPRLRDLTIPLTAASDLAELQHVPIHAELQYSLTHARQQDVPVQQQHSLAHARLQDVPVQQQHSLAHARMQHVPVQQQHRLACARQQDVPVQQQHRLAHARQQDVPVQQQHRLAHARLQHVPVQQQGTPTTADVLADFPYPAIKQRLITEEPEFTISPLDRCPDLLYCWDTDHSIDTTTQACTCPLGKLCFLSLCKSN